MFFSMQRNRFDQFAVSKGGRDAGAALLFAAWRRWGGWGGGAYGCACSPHRPHLRCPGLYPQPEWSSPGNPSDPPPAAASRAASGSLHELWPSLSLWRTLWVCRSIRGEKTKNKPNTQTHTKTNLLSLQTTKRFFFFLKHKIMCIFVYIVFYITACFNHNLSVPCVFLWTLATGGRCTPLKDNSTIFRAPQYSSLSFRGAS